METPETQFAITRTTTVNQQPTRHFDITCLACGTSYKGISSNALAKAITVHTGPARGHGTTDAGYVDINGLGYDPSLWFELPTPSPAEVELRG